MYIGGTLDLSGVGALLGGIELNAAGAITIAYGGTVAINSAAYMENNLNTLFSKANGELNNGGSKPEFKKPNLVLVRKKQLMFQVGLMEISHT